MAIINIHFLFPDNNHLDNNLAIQAQAAQQQLLIDAHRRGEHPWGSMRRECPLCQLGK